MYMMLWVDNRWLRFARNTIALRLIFMRIGWWSYRTWIWMGRDCRNWSFMSFPVVQNCSRFRPCYLSLRAKRWAVRSIVSSQCNGIAPFSENAVLMRKFPGDSWRIYLGWLHWSCKDSTPFGFRPKWMRYPACFFIWVYIIIKKMRCQPINNIFFKWI